MSRYITLTVLGTENITVGEGSGWTHQNCLLSASWALQDSQKITNLTLLLKLNDSLFSGCNSLKSNTFLGFTARKSIMTCFFPSTA